MRLAIAVLCAITLAACTTVSTGDVSSSPAAAAGIGAEPAPGSAGLPTRLPTASPPAPTSPAVSVPCVVLPLVVCGHGDRITFSTATGTRQFTYVGFRLEAGTPIYAPARDGFTWAKYPDCPTRQFHGMAVRIGNGAGTSVAYTFIGDLAFIPADAAKPLAVGERFASIAATGAMSFGDYNLIVTAGRLDQGQGIVAEDILQAMFPQSFVRASVAVMEAPEARACPPAITSPEYYSGPSAVPYGR